MQRFVIHALLLIAPVCAWSQPALPSWLLTYPGAHIAKNNMSAMSAASFTTGDPPETVVEYYRQVFESQGIAFAPKANSIATNIKADADCGELAITIFKRAEGSSVQMNCHVKFQPNLPQSTGNHEQDVANMMDAHRQAVAAMGIGRALPPAPAPPLKWPAWLTRAEGGLPSIQRASAPSAAGMLKAEYVSSMPMSKLFAFYKDALSANGFQIDRGFVQTGQTQSGVQQNADGEVEGNLYPDGSPGPYIEIRVRFSRMNLNDPITVTMAMRTYAFAGRKAFPQ